MREIRPSGSEGGVAHPRHPYPYFSERPYRDFNGQRLALISVD
jgi:hypothetical protein